MHDVVFESVRTLTQPEFAELVADRERQGDRHHYELLNGRVIMNPPAGYPHGLIGNRLQRLLGNFAHDQGLGHVFDSSQGFELPSGDTVEPDHSFVSSERWRAMAPPEEGKFLRVVPDLVAEVLSNRTASQDRGEKKAIYERNGVREYWLVDPRARELTVFVLGGSSYGDGTVHTESERVESHVLTGLCFLVSEILHTV